MILLKIKLLKAKWNNRYVRYHTDLTQWNMRFLFRRVNSFATGSNKSNTQVFPCGCLLLSSDQTFCWPMFARSHVFHQQQLTNDCNITLMKSNRRILYSIYNLLRYPAIDILKISSCEKKIISYYVLIIVFFSFMYSICEDMSWI